MKKISYGLFCLLVLAFSLAGHEIVYTEGRVKIKTAGDLWREAEIGASVEAGDTIITEYNGYVEIETPESLLSINSDTVFLFAEIQEQEVTRDALTCVTGSVKFKIEKLLGPGPFINTLSANAGVRGTEFTLFAAADGSSLVSVSEGVVLVVSSGEAVELRQAEGVEVKPGDPPGAKFPVLGGQLDFREWNERQMERFLSDPVAAVYRLLGRLEAFSGEIELLDAAYQLNREQLTGYRARLAELKDNGEREAAREYYETEILPLEVITSHQVLNIRYYALSALSLRRYLLSRLYLLMKVKHLGRDNARAYTDYLYAHRQALDFYAQKIVPFLVEADI